MNKTQMDSLRQAIQRNYERDGLVATGLEIDYLQTYGDYYKAIVSYENSLNLVVVRTIYFKMRVVWSGVEDFTEVSFENKV